MNMIEEGLSNNDLACAANCITSAELAVVNQSGARLAIKTVLLKEKEERNDSRVVSHFWQGGRLRPWSPPVEMVTPDTPIAGTGTNENAFSHLAGAASDHFAAGQAHICSASAERRDNESADVPPAGIRKSADSAE
ncbi:hypothetical protein EDB87DRAFT_1574729 [Lactarius vividus]|nr:hypothetical protein EDB87DRAFT_1574729 [Lactarius vividus]